MSTSSAARQFVTWAPLAALLIVLLPALAAAQEPVKSFDQLNTRLRPGDSVWITDAQGREIKGRVLEMTPASLVLDAGRRRALDARDVIAVRERGGRSLGKAALWGTVAGAGAGTILAVTVRSDYATYCTPEDGASCFPQPGTKPPVDWWQVPVYAGLGAGLGTIIGSLMPGPLRVVYRAPGRAEGADRGARLSVMPVITPRHRSVALSVSF